MKNSGWYGTGQDHVRLFDAAAQHGEIAATSANLKKRQKGLQPCFAIGDYRLGNPLPNACACVHLSPGEHMVMQNIEAFGHQALLHAPAVYFMGLVWQAILGMDDAVVSSVAVHWEGTPDQARVVVKELTHYCRRRYRRGSHSGSCPFRWRASDGEILIHTRRPGSQVSLNVILSGVSRGC